MAIAHVALLAWGFAPVLAIVAALVLAPWVEDRDERDGIQL